MRRASASGHVSGTPSEATGGADVAIAVSRAEAGPVCVDQADVTPPLGIAFQGKRLPLSLAKPGRITAKGAEITERVPATAPLAIVLRAADAPLLALDFAARPPAMTHAVRAEAQTLQANVMRAGGPPIPVSIESARADLKGSLPPAGGYRGEARVSAASIEMPDTGLSGERGSASAAFAEGEVLYNGIRLPSPWPPDRPPSTRNRIAIPPTLICSLTLVAIIVPSVAPHW